jgi:hypothetical protein
VDKEKKQMKSDHPYPGKQYVVRPRFVFLQENQNEEEKGYG